MLTPKEFLLQRNSLYISNGVYTIIPISRRKGLLDLPLHIQRIYDSYTLSNENHNLDDYYNVNQYQYLESLIRTSISTTLSRYRPINDESNDHDSKNVDGNQNNNHCNCVEHDHIMLHDGYITISAGKLRDGCEKLSIDSMFTLRPSINCNVVNARKSRDDVGNDDGSDGSIGNSSNDSSDERHGHDHNDHRSEFLVDFIHLSRQPVRAKYIQWIVERAGHERIRLPCVHESILLHDTSTTGNRMSMIVLVFSISSLT